MRHLRVLAGLALVAAGLFSPAAVAAQSGVEMTTPYPAVVVDPGGSATFTVTVTSDTPQRVNLSVTGTPDGWTTKLHGGGFTVSAVETSADPTTPTTFSLEVDVPAGTEAKDYNLVLHGAGTTGAPELPLTVTVAALEAGSVTFDAVSPDKQGTATTNFSFDLNLKNGTNAPLTFRYDATAPAGWRATAQPSTDTQAASTTVDSGGSTGVHVTVTPAPDATAGSYKITVTATGGPEPISTDLTVEITGTYGLSLSTTDGRLNADVTIGSANTLTLVVTNTGDSPLTSIALTATPPANWKVDFDLPTIDQLAPQETQNVIATITPASDAIAGDYDITFNARSTDARDSADIRTSVQGSLVGGLLGLGILALVAVGLLFVFRQYGRR